MQKDPILVNIDTTLLMSHITVSSEDGNDGVYETLDEIEKGT